MKFWNSVVGGCVGFVDVRFGGGGRGYWSEQIAVGLGTKGGFFGSGAIFSANFL